MSINLKKTVFFCIVFIGIIQTAFVTSFDIIGATAAYASLICFMIIWRYNNIYPDFEYKKIFQILLLLGIIETFRGLFEAKTYWDWKFMFFDTVILMFIPIISFAGNKKYITQAMFYNYIKYLLPFSIVILYLARHSINEDGFARFVSPLYYLILFIPILNKKWRFIIILVMVISFFSDVGNRSNMIRIIIANCIMLIYFFRFVINKWVLEIFRNLLFITPFVLFVLALTGTFNIFKAGEDRNDEFVTKQVAANGEIEENDLTADTRTFIYEEEINSSIYRNTWLFGEGADAGYISPSFEETNVVSKGRGRSEVCIMNIFNVYGICGVLLFTLIFYLATYLCVNR